MKWWEPMRDDILSMCWSDAVGRCGRTSQGILPANQTRMFQGVCASSVGYGSTSLHLNLDFILSVSAPRHVSYFYRQAVTTKGLSCLVPV